MGSEMCIRDRISFDRRFLYWNPEQFPTANSDIRDSLVVAPFWSDSDVRMTGDVFYKLIEIRGTNTSVQDQTLINYVSKFIANTHTHVGNFSGSTMLVAQWKSVPPSPHGETEPGFASTTRHMEFFNQVCFNGY